MHDHMIIALGNVHACICFAICDTVHNSHFESILVCLNQCILATTFARHSLTLSLENLASQAAVFRQRSSLFLQTVIPCVPEDHCSALLQCTWSPLQISASEFIIMSHAVWQKRSSLFSLTVFSICWSLSCHSSHESWSFCMGMSEGVSDAPCLFLIASSNLPHFLISLGLCVSCSFDRWSLQCSTSLLLALMTCCAISDVE